MSWDRLMVKINFSRKCLSIKDLLNSRFILQEFEELPDVFNDFDVDFSANPHAADEYIRDQRNRRNIREATKRLNLNLMAPLREGKKLLVLDIDYSLSQPKSLSSTSCDIFFFCSDFGYQTFNWRSVTPCRMCTAISPWIFRSRIPLLWYLYLVSLTTVKIGKQLRKGNALRSQTSWIWLETKLHELGMIGGNRQYKVRILCDEVMVL